MTDQELDDLAAEHERLRAIRDDADGRMAELKTHVGTELSLRGLDKVDLPRHSVAIVASSRRTLNKQKLLEHGVTMDQIEASSDETTSISVRVSARKGTNRKATAAGG